jgi:cytochrome c
MPEDHIDDPLAPRGGSSSGFGIARYVIILAGCLFAMFYAYIASREDAAVSTEQSKLISQPNAQASANPAPKPDPAQVAETSPSVAEANSAAPPAQTPAPPPAPAPTFANAPPAASPPAASTGPAPSQGAQSPPAKRTAQSYDELELAFNGHCRECHSFVKDDIRLGPSLYGVVGRKAGTEAGFAYSDSVKSSGITWDEPTLDKWITNPNALVPGNNMGVIFGGVADAAERAKIIAFLKQDTQTSPPVSNSNGQLPPAKQ